MTGSDSKGKMMCEREREKEREIKRKGGGERSGLMQA